MASTSPPRRDTTTSSEIAVNVNAVHRARLTINSELLALAKIVHDEKTQDLIASANRVNQVLAVRLLEKREHEVTVAGNGEEALETLGKQTFDLILMDVQMPEMDGLQATVAIRRGEMESEKHIPIIAMTAHAMAGDKDRCLEAGMDDYITKPIRPEQLGDVLKRYSFAPT